MASKWTKFLAFGVALWCVACVHSEVFTAIFEMENLVYREREMVAALNDYLKQEEARLDKIRRFAQKVDEMHAAIEDNKVEEYLGHPTNSFLLIKRFVKDWDAIEKLARTPEDEGMQSKYHHITC